MDKWIKENKITTTLVIILAIIFGIVYFNKQTIPPPADFQENTQQIKQSDNIRTVTNLYNQMSPTLPPHDLYCIPSKKSHCSLAGCKDVEANIFILLGKTQKADGLFMARCDNKPCDVYDVNLLQSGAFTTFETKEPHGMLFRTSQLDQSFIEVVTLGTESLISNGFCYSK